jgi:hypothetical protein
LNLAAATMEAVPGLTHNFATVTRDVGFAWM